MDLLKSIYQANPVFINDILHLHFFKTTLYYDEKMNDFPRLGISSQLKTSFFMIDYATSYSVENGIYKFKFKSDFLFLPEKVPFPLLFNALIRVGFNGNDIEDMYIKFYKSEEAILIRLAEQFKNKHIFLSSELFEFIKRKECNPSRNWEINEIISGTWNYTLLALNQRVWETAFDIKYLNNLFQKEKIELDKIDAGKLYSGDDFLDHLMSSPDDYPNHIKRVDLLIQKKLK